MSLIISNIQRMSLDDGPGIRTTVFLQGCNLFCPWCSNPETQSICEGSPFPSKAYNVEELYMEICRDKAFWEEEGGITFSGGEPLLQVEELSVLCEKLKKEHIHIAIETSLSVCSEKVNKLIDLIDFWYVDIKILDQMQAKILIGLDTKQYISNINLCRDKGCNIHFRIPCSREWVLTSSNWELMKDFLLKYREYPVELFAIHDLAKSKYVQLEKELPLFMPLSNEELSQKKSELERLGINVNVISL